MTEEVPRFAARVLLLAPDGRALLLNWIDPDTGFRWWVTPGGGIDPGEAPEAAARREVYEETGLRDFALGPCVWVRETSFRFQGRGYRQRERIYVAEVERFEPRPGGLEEVEQGMLLGHRWWAAGEIEGSGELFGPRRLGRLLAGLLAEGYPPAPVDVGR